MPRKSEKEKIITALSIQYCTNTVFMDSSSDSSDDDEPFEIFHNSLIATMVNRRGVHLRVPKTIEWREKILDELDDFRFRQMMRVSRAEFEHILCLIKNDPVFNSTGNCHQFPIKLQLQIALYRMGSSGESGSIRKVASIFGVGDGGTLQIVTNRVITSINNLKKQFIYWPNEYEKKHILWRSKNELPGNKIGKVTCNKSCGVLFPETAIFNKNASDMRRQFENSSSFLRLRW